MFEVKSFFSCLFGEGKKIAAESLTRRGNAYQKSRQAQIDYI
jgi:hypothetical protein